MRMRDYLENTFDDLPPNAVLLNVYDITWGNALLSPLGIGVHHTGVEVYGREYSYGRSTSGTGIFEVAPKKCTPHVFKESIVLGYTNINSAQLRFLVGQMSVDWLGPDYHIVRKNCNVFSGFFAAEILSKAGDALQQPDNGVVDARDVYDGPRGLCGVLPSWVNRVATAGVRYAPRLSDAIDHLDRTSQGM